MTLGSGGGGHTAVAGSILNAENLIPALTVLTPVYTEVTALALPAVVTGVLSVAAGKTVLGYL